MEPGPSEANRRAFLSAEATYFRSLGLKPSTRTVPLANVGCSVRVSEVGDGPPIVFIHGTMTSGASWANLVAALPEFRCVMLDRPGCGLSELPPTPPDGLVAQRAMADRLVTDVLDALELDRAHLISNSLGGWFGFRGAGAPTAADRINRIVGMGFQAGAPIEHAPFLMRLSTPSWMVPRFGIGKGMVKRMLTMAGMGGAIRSGGFSDEMLDYMVALLNNTDTMVNEIRYAPRPIGLRGAIKEAEHDQTLLARIDSPTTLFWGTDDPFGGELVARQFAARLPEATVRMIQGAGHAPWLDEPTLAAETVRQHLLG